MNRGIEQASASTANESRPTQLIDAKVVEASADVSSSTKEKTATTNTVVAPSGFTSVRFTFTTRAIRSNAETADTTNP